VDTEDGEARREAIMVEEVAIEDEGGEGGVEGEGGGVHELKGGQGLAL
jgi:hypothetical protein